MIPYSVNFSVTIFVLSKIFLQILLKIILFLPFCGRLECSGNQLRAYFELRCNYKIVTLLFFLSQNLAESISQDKNGNSIVTYWRVYWKVAFKVNDCKFYLELPHSFILCKLKVYSPNHLININLKVRIQSSRQLT